MENKIVNGVAEIAVECGVSIRRVREWILEFPDFPARREGHNGMWLSTRRTLHAWMDNYVTTPDPDRDVETPEPVRPKVKRGRPRKALH